MKKTVLLILSLIMILSFSSCKTNENLQNTLVYGSGDYTRINPALDEHGEINVLLFNGLTARNGKNEIIPCLAKEWTFDEETNTYTFNLEENVKWHDGEKFTANDVKFTIEAIMDLKNQSENAPNFEDVEEITVIDDYTVSFKLSAPNVAFLDYMTMAILPKHKLENEDMKESEFFKKPVGTGPYKLEAWIDGMAITLVKNSDYFKKEANIDKIVFKIVESDSVKAIALKSGELDLALLTPKDAQIFEKTDFNVYNMKTSDYRGIMFNFNNEYWQKNRCIIPAICYGINKKAIVDTVISGHGEVAYSPLQRNIYNNENVEKYEYNPQKAKEILENNGCKMNENGFYTLNGEEVGFVLNAPSGDQVRIDIAQAVAQNLKEIGINCKVEIPTTVDWGNQMAYLIGWGSPFDADDHTYKVFGTDKGANYSAYSNQDVDKYLTLARKTDNKEKRAEFYNEFQYALANDPAYAFICYIDADYVANPKLKGIDKDAVMGHHGVGIFYNVTDWSF